MKTPNILILWTSVANNYLERTKGSFRAPIKAEDFSKAFIAMKSGWGFRTQFQTPAGDIDARCPFARPLTKAATDICSPEGQSENPDHFGRGLFCIYQSLLTQDARFKYMGLFNQIVYGMRISTDVTNKDYGYIYKDKLKAAGHSQPPLIPISAIDQNFEALCKKLEPAKTLRQRAKEFRLKWL